MNTESYGKIKNCFLSKDFETFQKIVFDKSNDSTVNTVIVDLFNNRKEDDKSWKSCSEFIKKLPLYTKGVQDLNPVQVIGEISARFILNKKIIDAVTIINTITEDTIQDNTITKACIECSKQEDFQSFSVSNFIAQLSNTTKDKENLIARVFYNLSRTSENRTDEENLTIQNNTYKLIKIFFDLKETTSENRINTIIKKIENSHPLEKIKSKELRDFYNYNFCIQKANEFLLKKQYINALGIIYQNTVESKEKQKELLIKFFQQKNIGNFDQNFEENVLLFFGQVHFEIIDQDVTMPFSNYSFTTFSLRNLLVVVKTFISKPNFLVIEKLIEYAFMQNIESLKKVIDEKLKEEKISPSNSKKTKSSQAQNVLELKTQFKNYDKFSETISKANDYYINNEYLNTLATLFEKTQNSKQELKEILEIFFKQNGVGEFKINFDYNMLMFFDLCHKELKGKTWEIAKPIGNFIFATPHISIIMTIIKQLMKLEYFEIVDSLINDAITVNVKKCLMDISRK